MTLAFQGLPALVEKGWSAGGFSGVLIATTLLWGSLVKRSWTSATTASEQETLPRVDEFAAALAAADDVQATIYPCDMELDVLLQALSSSSLTVLREAWRGWQGDPVRRQRGESLVAWAQRRRDIATARASRAHGELVTPTLSRALVQQRDALFAQACQQAVQDVMSSIPVIEESEHDTGTEATPNAVVCIVGLVHLDGVARLLQEGEETLVVENSR